MAKQLIILIGIVFVLVGCLGQPAEDLVARWQGGSLSRIDLESFIIGFPLPEDRIVDEKDPGAWWREQAEETILERLLVEAAAPAVRDGLEAALRDELRVLVAESEILKRLGPIVEPSEESLESAWVELESTLKSPERRQLLNIFRRATDPSAQKIALDELEDLRRRVVAGESFGRIAEAFSDSESRHRRGMVGVFERGQLDPGLEEIVFSLTPDIPSEPVSTDDGGHLFLVRSVFPERSLRYEESRPELVRHVLAEKHRTRLEETARELWQPMESDVILDPDELERVLRSTENGIVLRVGSFEVNRNEWLRRSRSNSGASVNQRRVR